ncbi:hypothetical protein KUCAC02_016574 [Chaenocephalus aceratus]|nr:hypothetical protein KUCAC02_016574 [Chaenocephalus aceratus]
MPTTRNTLMDPESLGKLIRDIIREEITSALEDKLKPIQDSLSKLQVTAANSVFKIQDLEESANETDSRLTQLENDYKLLQSSNAKCMQKIEVFEDQNRKFNIRIYGLKEGRKQGSPTAYVTELLADLFGQNILGPLPTVSYAYRNGPAKGNRCITARLNSFETKKTLLSQSKVTQGHEKGEKLQYRDQRINIYPDLSAKLREQRAEFNAVRSLLRSANMKYGLVYPAKFLITFEKVTHAFAKAEEAMDFYQTQIKPTLESVQTTGNKSAE